MAAPLLTGTRASASQAIGRSPALAAILLGLALACVCPGARAGSSSANAPRTEADQCAPLTFPLHVPISEHVDCIEMPGTAADRLLDLDPARRGRRWLEAKVAPKCGCAFLTINTLNDKNCAARGETGLWPFWGLHALLGDHAGINPMGEAVAIGLEALPGFKVTEGEGRLGEYNRWGVALRRILLPSMPPTEIPFTEGFPVLPQSAAEVMRPGAGLPYAFAGRLVDLTDPALGSAPPLFQCPADRFQSQTSACRCFGSPDSAGAGSGPHRLTPWEQDRGVFRGKDPMGESELGDPEGTLYYASLAFRDPPEMVSRLVRALNHRFRWAGPKAKAAVDTLGTAWAKVRNPEQYYCAHRLMLELGTRYDVGSPALFWMILSEQLSPEPLVESTRPGEWGELLRAILSRDKWLQGWIAEAAAKGADQHQTEWLAQQFVMMQYAREAIAFDILRHPEDSIAEWSRWIQDLLWAETTNVWVHLKAAELSAPQYRQYDTGRTYDNYMSMHPYAPDCPAVDKAYGRLLATLAGQSARPRPAPPGSEGVPMETCKDQTYQLAFSHAKNGIRDIFSDDVMATLFSRRMTQSLRSKDLIKKVSSRHEDAGWAADRRALMAVYAGVNMMLLTGVDTPLHLIKGAEVSFPFARAGSLREAVGGGLFGQDRTIDQCMGRWQVLVNADSRSVEDDALPRVKDSMLEAALTMFTADQSTLYSALLAAFRRAIHVHYPDLTADFDDAFPDTTGPAPSARTGPPSVTLAVVPHDVYVRSTRDDAGEESWDVAMRRHGDDNGDRAATLPRREDDDALFSPRNGDDAEPGPMGSQGSDVYPDVGESSDGDGSVGSSHGPSRQSATILPPAGADAYPTLPVGPKMPDDASLDSAKKAAAAAKSNSPGPLVCLLSAYATLARREDALMPIPLVGLWFAEGKTFNPMIVRDYVYTAENAGASASERDGFSPLEVARLVCGQANVRARQEKLKGRFEVGESDAYDSFFESWVLVDCMTDIIFGSNGDVRRHQPIVASIRAEFFGEFLAKTLALPLEPGFAFAEFDALVHCSDHTIGGRFFRSVERMIEDDRDEAGAKLGKDKRLTFWYTSVQSPDGTEIYPEYSEATAMCRNGNIIPLMEAAAHVRRKNLEYQQKFLLNARMHHYPHVFERSLRGIAALKSVEGVLKLFFDLFQRPDFLVDVFLEHYENLSKDEEEKVQHEHDIQDAIVAKVRRQGIGSRRRKHVGKQAKLRALSDRKLRQQHTHVGDKAPADTAKVAPEPASGAEESHGDPSAEPEDEKQVHAMRTRDHACLAAIGVVSKAIFNSLEYIDLEANLRSKLQDQYAITFHMRVMEKAWKALTSLPIIGGLLELIVDSAKDVIGDTETMLAAQMQKLFADLKSIFLDLELVLQSADATFESIRLEDDRVVDHLCYLLHNWCANPQADPTCALAFEKIRRHDRFSRVNVEGVCAKLRRTIQIDYKMTGETSLKSKLANFMNGIGAQFLAYQDPQGVDLGDSRSMDVTFE